MISDHESGFPGVKDSLRRLGESAILEMETESGIGESGITGKKTGSVVSVLGKSEMAGMPGKATESVISETVNESLFSAMKSSLSGNVSLMTGLLVDAWSLDHRTLLLALA